MTSCNVSCDPISPMTVYPVLVMRSANIWPVVRCAKVPALSRGHFQFGLKGETLVFLNAKRHNFLPSRTENVHVISPLNGDKKGRTSPHSGSSCGGGCSLIFCANNGLPTTCPSRGACCKIQHCWQVTKQPITVQCKWTFDAVTFQTDR